MSSFVAAGNIRAFRADRIANAAFYPEIAGRSHVTVELI